MSLSTRATEGVKWSSLSRFGSRAAQFVTLAIQARLLSPDEFGLVGLIVPVVGFVTIFKDLGTSAAIIHRKRVSQELLSSVFWINVFFGLFATTVLIVIAPLIASFFQDDRVPPLLALLSLTFSISGLSILQQALLERDLAFDRLAKAEITAVICASLVGVGAAVLGAGALSLVLQALTLTVVSTILLWVLSPWRPTFALKWNEVMSVSSYSSNFTGFNIFNYFARNMDNILIGKFLGTEALGFYSLAYQIMLYPVQNISGAIGRVTFPVYSQIQDDEKRFRATYLRVAGAVSLISFPLMFGILILSQPLVISVFGSRWEPTASVLVILAPIGLAQSIGTTVGSIYQAKGRTDWMFRWGLVSGLIRIVAFAVGLRWGIEGVAIGYVISTLILSYHNFAIPFKLIDLKVSELLKTLWVSLEYSLVMLGCVAGVRLLWARAGVGNSWIVLISSALTGIATYGGLLLWRRPPLLQDVLSLLGVPWLRRLVSR